MTKMGFYNDIESPNLHLANGMDIIYLNLQINITKISHSVSCSRWTRVNGACGPINIAVASKECPLEDLIFIYSTSQELYIHFVFCGILLV